MTDFRDLMAVADAAVVDMLHDKTVTVKRDGVVVSSDATDSSETIKAIFDKDMQVVDSNGLIQGFADAFTLNKADLTVSTLKERDEIIDGTKTWYVMRPQAEDATMINVLVS